MATHYLPADTLLSSLLPSGGGSLASGDTIDFDGHTLVMDCDAVDYPFTPANAGGTECRLELRDLSRIKINASLPATVHPWVDPEHPLPVSTPGVAEGVDGHVTGLTANARAEIQLTGNFGLGGGSASLSTETREGAFWANVLSSPSTTELVFDRDLPLHAGDVMLCLAAYNSMTRCTVAEWNAETRTATFSNTLPRRSAGDLWAVAAGGVCISLLAYVNATPFLTAPVKAGTLLVLATSDSSGNSRLSDCGVSAEFLCALVGTNVSNYRASLAGGGASIVAEKCICGIVANSSCNDAFIRVGEIAANSFYHNNSSAINARIFIGGGEFGELNFNYSYFKPFDGEGCNVLLRGLHARTMNSLAFASRKEAYRVVDCDMPNVPSGDVQVESSGTVTRTARTDFPAATDLPDAFYHAPATAGNVTWRYEDRWVRKGETLRMRARWMPPGAGARASVAVTEHATWWPDLWPLGAEALAAREFAGGTELQWTGGEIAWRNDSGEDCQVRVWECVTGSTLGGYLRVWESTGGPM